MGARIKRRYLPSIERRLLKLFYAADALTLAHGKSWYNQQNLVCAELASLYSITVEQACGVVAALSPGSNWEINVRNAESFIGEYANGKRGNKLTLVGSYGWRNMRLAERVLSGKGHVADIPMGPKVNAFFWCLFNPLNTAYVVVDRHAKCACLGEWSAENQTVQRSEYDYFAEYYFRAASKAGVSPMQLQAVCWIEFRRESAIRAIKRKACPTCATLHNLEQYYGHCSLDCLNREVPF